MTILPADLRAALARLSEGVSRRDLGERARTISETYRSGGTSKPITDTLGAIAYATVRMPATYAATAACLTALNEVRPNFSPASLIDAGTGPGTVAWAATHTFESITDFLLLDANPTLVALARDLAAGDSRIGHAGFRTGDIIQLLSNAPAADLVVASYLVGELDERTRTELALTMWERTRDTLLVIEPGTPAGYARIIALRARLIAEGAHVTAPCPHDKACPLVAPDWCHFAQRLPRLRDHMLTKDAEVPFEDEKFSYVALSRTPAEARGSRILAPPRVGKAAIEAKLCTADGVIGASIAHRDKAAYARARRWRWGETAT